MVHRTMGLPHKSEPKNSYCVIWDYAPFDVPLSHKMLNISDNKPYLIRIDWNLDTKHPAAEVYVDNRKRLTVPLRNESQHGLSYVHFLSDTRIDDQGYEIEWVKAEVGR